MKKLAIFAPFIIAVFMYLLFVFVEWHFNPGEWSKSSRFTYSMITFLIICVIEGLVLTEIFKTNE